LLPFNFWFYVVSFTNFLLFSRCKDTHFILNSTKNGSICPLQRTDFHQVSKCLYLSTILFVLIVLISRCKDTYFFFNILYLSFFCVLNPIGFRGVTLVSRSWSRASLMESIVEIACRMAMNALVTITLICTALGLCKTEASITAPCSVHAVTHGPATHKAIPRLEGRPHAHSA